MVSNFVLQALRNEPITIYGDGQQTRSFCYVSDLVEGMVRMMEQETEVGPVNLGNPAEITILELAETVIELTGSTSALQSLPLPLDDPTRRRPDITRAQERLDWTPSVPLREGLKSTIAYFRPLAPC